MMLMMVQWSRIRKVNIKIKAKFHSGAAQEAALKHLKKKNWMEVAMHMCTDTHICRYSYLSKNNFKQANKSVKCNATKIQCASHGNFQ